MDDIHMSEPQLVDETPRMKAQRLLKTMQDHPEMYEDLKNQMDELFDNIDRSVLTLIGQGKGPSFAQVTARQPIVQKQKSFQNKKANLFIKPEGNKECKEIFKEIKEKIQPQKENISVSKISIINSKLIKIVTESKQDAGRMKEILTERVDSIKVDEEKKFKPRIIVFGVESKMEDQELFEQIYHNNSQIRENVEWNSFVKNVKVLKRTKESNTMTVNVIIEIHPLLRSYLYIDRKQKLKIDWKTLNWNDSFFVLRCRKCLRVGHHHSNCQNKQTCSKCGKEHKSEICTHFQTPHCYLCGLQSKHPEQLDHVLGDKKCSVHQNALNRQKLRVDYNESANC